MRPQTGADNQHCHKDCHKTSPELERYLAREFDLAVSTLGSAVVWGATSYCALAVCPVTGIREDDESEVPGDGEHGDVDSLGEDTGATGDREHGTPRAAPWVFILAAVAICVVVFNSDSALINDGDYLRVTSYLHIDIAKSLPIHANYPFIKSLTTSSTPGSLLAFIAWLIYEVGSVIGLKTFDPAVLTILEYLVYFVGVYVASEQLRSRRGLVTAAWFFGLFFLLGFFLRSFYEESTILVLSPWLYAGLLAMKERGRFVLFGVAASLVILSKDEMAIFAPILVVVMLVYLPRTRGNLVRVVAVAAVLLGSAVIMIHKSSVAGMTSANSYDRVYGGLGYAMGGVASWPTSTNETRNAYALANQNTIPRQSCSAFPAQVRQYLGSVYWNTGHDLRAIAFGPSGTQVERDAFNRVIQEGSFSSYLKDLVECPELGPKLTYNTVVVAAKGDYRLGYIRSQPTNSPALFRAFNAVHNFVLANLGWIVACLLTALLVVVRGLWRRIVVLVGLFAVLLATVAGDGYFELEKHLLGSVMLLPLAWFVGREEWLCRRAGRPL